MILVVDAMPLVYQAHATVGHFKTTAGELTGVRYGFLRSLRSWSELVEARKTIVVWDMKGKIEKAEGFEQSYKSNRPDTPDVKTMYEQIDPLKRLLSLTNYTQVGAPGFEADDLCKTIADMYVNKHQEKVIIATVDRDVFTAITPEITVLHTANGERNFVEIPGVISHFGFMPRWIPVWKALVGDTSDVISGQINDSAAQQRLKQYLGTEPNVTDEEVIDKFLAPDSIESDTAKRQLVLTRLHEVPYERWEVRKGLMDSQALEKEFTHLEFKSMMKHLEEFTTPDIKGYRARVDAEKRAAKAAKAAKKAAK